MTSNKGKIYVVGIGTGSEQSLSIGARCVLGLADAIVGYKYYFQFVIPYIKEHAECIDNGMKQEEKRAERAFELAEAGKTVCVISSGDSGIYGMAPLIYEMAMRRGSDIEIEALPGISAFQEASALLGAPVGHDFCVVSLSDLMTPWATIEKRIIAAAEADFVTAIYNPKSIHRYWQLERLKELFLKVRDPKTPVGIVRQAGREEQEVHITTLADFDCEPIDMFTIVIIGNSQSFIDNNHFITPRGYYRPQKENGEKLGQQIMIKSFQTIEGLLKHNDYPLGHKWALLHAIHTTADFEMEDILFSTSNAVELLHQALASGKVKNIITDVTMVTSGIRKAATKRMGIDVKCYLPDPRTKEMAERLGITRTQAGIRLAVQDHPDALYAFGNAPTALLELADLIRKGEANPIGVIAAPVGFVHVCESKHAIKPFRDIPKIIIEGNKGGSNIAATLCNAVLSFDDAAALRPGRDV